MKLQNQSMLQGPLLKNVILYTIPIVLTSWLQLLFNAADLVIVGQFDGSNCLAAVGADVYALSCNNISHLRFGANGFDGSVTVNKTPGILFISNKNGVISADSSSLNLLSSKNKSALTNIYWERAGDYTKITFFTQFPAAAQCEVRDNHLILKVSPCRVGLFFECPYINYMINEKTESGVKYTFALPKAAEESYVEEKKDRIILYFK